MQIVPVKELRERHLGVLEGLTRSQAALQYPNDFANLSGAPGAKPQARKFALLKYRLLVFTTHGTKDYVHAASDLA